MNRLVLASGNPGKLREFSALLAPLGLEVCSQAELGVAPCAEPYASFVVNALEKARHASRQTGWPALADDSGICVDVLAGAPGVYSARYSERAGGPAGDDANNQLLVRQLAAHKNRGASYYCVLVLVRAADDPQPLIADGSWSGEVILEPRGNGGFGYDPYFLLPELGKTAAELPADLKNAISHRAQALRVLVAKLKAAKLALALASASACPSVRPSDLR